MKLYLDHNATTPMDAQVVEAMLACMTDARGNASSSHQFGRAVRARLDQAREQVARLVGVQAEQVIFTGSGTEANNLAILGASRALQKGRIAVSSIEHPSVLEPAQELERQGWALDLIACNRAGEITPAQLKKTLGADTRMVSVMAANNETGVLQDIASLAAIAKAQGALFHTDAVQALGKVPLDFQASGAHLMSLSAHKIYGPAGVGALIYDRSVEIEAQMLGGGQEKGFRSGTENLAGIVGFGVAADRAQQSLESWMVSVKTLREQLEDGLKRHPEVTLFAATSERLPNTLQLAVDGIDGEALLMQLDREGIAVSSGSACSSDSSEPSHVLLAMGVDAQGARGAIRISLGRDTRKEDIEYLLQVLGQQIQWLKKSGNVAGW